MERPQNGLLQNDHLPNILLPNIHLQNVRLTNVLFTNYSFYKMSSLCKTMLENRRIVKGRFVGVHCTHPHILDAPQYIQQTALRPFPTAPPISP
jgi:hypothetical protein